MLFSEVVGQKKLKNKITHMVQRGQIPHAMLLLGQEGNSALPLALALAQYIQCENKQETGSCGECKGCSKVSSLQHPDVHFVFPAIKEDNDKTNPSTHYLPAFRQFVSQHPYGNDTDWFQFIEAGKQGNIYASDCRAILGKLQLRSFEAEYKVLIMWYPEYLDQEGNILLKMIEEPTPKTILILAAENSEKILPTILSRTQLFSLERTSETELSAFLVSQGHHPDDAGRVSRMAEGSIHAAMRMLQQDGDDYLLRLRNWLNALYANKGIELSDWSQELAALSKETQKDFWAYVLQIFEHYLRFRVMGPTGIELQEAEYKLVQTLNSLNLNESTLEMVQNEITESLYFLSRNANAKILYHSLSLRIQALLLKSKHSLPVT